MNISKARFVRLIVAMLLFIAGVFAFHSSGLAQQGGDRDRDQGDRNDDTDRELRREKYRRDFNLNGYLKKLDDNKNGVLEKGELTSDRTRRYLSDMGINVNNSVPIDLAVRQAESHSAKKRDAAREKFEAKVGPKLNSFGTELSQLGVTSFGVDEEESAGVASFDERLSGLKQSDFDEDTLAEARKILKGYDRDNSGFLEGDEIGRIRWKDPSPTESDLNGDGRISMLEMAQRITDRSEKSREKDANRKDDRDDKDRDDKNDGKRRRDKESRDDNGGRGEGEGSRGFSDRGGRGGQGKGEKGGRGDRYGGRDSSKSSPTATKRVTSKKSSESRSTSSISTKPTKASASREKAFITYVNNVYKKYDTDKDQKLSAAELKKMKRPFKGDSNSDGYLSKEEAIDFIKVGQKGAKSDSKSTASTTSTPVKIPAANSGTKKTSRSNSTAAAGGLNAEKRGSLSDVDANADGQIQMSEFSSKWDEETLQSFRKTDANGDGILSASEWAGRNK